MVATTFRTTRTRQSAAFVARKITLALPPLTAPTPRFLQLLILPTKLLDFLSNATFARSGNTGRVLAYSVPKALPMNIFVSSAARIFTRSIQQLTGESLHEPIFVMNPIVLRGQLNPARPFTNGFEWLLLRVGRAGCARVFTPTSIAHITNHTFEYQKKFSKTNHEDSRTKYSKYLPLNRASRATSRATSIAKDDKNGSSKNSRPSTATQSSKRRSTMNSRDAAYDDEQLRRAIEASKEDNALETVEGATRRAKRGRSDSEDNNNASIKRQRTSSRSASPPAEKQEPVDEQVSDDETETRNGAKKSKNNQQHREKSEKEDRERQRQEAANKRKGRAERRRAEDSDLSEEMPLAAAKAVQQKPAESPSKEESPSVAQPPGTPPPTHPTASSSHKRGARANKRGKGRNQYSKDRDQDDESPARSMSRDIQKGDEATTTGHSKSSVNEHKTSKAKASTTNKMSMLDMKRRVAALMEFISRTQVDLAAEASFSQSSSGRETPQEKPEPNQTNGSTVNGHTPDPFDMSRFKGLSCMEMMDVLTRVMVKWQNQYS
ncbi:Histone deacetylase complex subunit, variant 2 [Metarhizium acridum]|uniref:Histone deacetylase complex subunit, variant 2 n=1 Tax=Metarhizium acridum TaxID=92637 RepID=UPI001C6AFCEF|nr:Histone deacetylase complex subunit, variant 2 [Metarhizium acridum]